MGFGNKQPWSGVSALSHNGSVVLRKLLILPGLIFLIDITMAPEAHSSASCPYKLTHLNENRKISERLSSFAMIRMLISKIIGEEGEEQEGKKPPSLGGMLFSSILGKFFL